MHSKLRELNSDPRVNKPSYYASSMIPFLDKFNETTDGKYKESIQFIKNTTSKIIKNEDSEYFLDLVIALLRLKIKIIKNEIEKANSKLFFFQKVVVEEIKPAEIIPLEGALVQVKAAIFKFLVLTDVDREAMKSFTDILPPDLQKAFSDFWGYGYNLNNTSKVKEVKVDEDKYAAVSSPENPQTSLSLQTSQINKQLSSALLRMSLYYRETPELPSSETPSLRRIV